MGSRKSRRSRKTSRASDLKRGTELRRALNGNRAGKTSPVLHAMTPELEDIVNEVMFGRIWARPGLDMKTRCVAVIASLAALQRLPQLKTYIANGLNAGLTREEIIEVLLQLVFYIGLPAVTCSLEIAAETFHEQVV